MSDKVFIDTNVLVYAHTDLDPVKQSVAQKLEEEHKTYISTQVLNELANTLNRKFKQNWVDIIGILHNTISNNSLYVNNDETVFQACQIAGRYKFSL